MADEEEEVSSGFELTTDEIFILVAVVLAAAVFLALYLDQQAVAGIGVGIVSGFASPITAFFNGIAQAISALFNWISHALSSLWILKARLYMIVLSTKKIYLFVMR